VQESSIAQYTGSNPENA